MCSTDVCPDCTCSSHSHLGGKAFVLLKDASVAVFRRFTGNAPSSSVWHSSPYKGSGVCMEWYEYCGVY